MSSFLASARSTAPLGIAVGLKKGHIVTKRAKSELPSRRKGVSSEFIPLINISSQFHHTSLFILFFIHFTSQFLIDFFLSFVIIIPFNQAFPVFPCLHELSFIL
jgi:hypothetical protein